jgi:hypothetical protein
MRLRRPPLSPTGMSWLTLGVSTVPETWTQYLLIAA